MDLFEFVAGKWAEIPSCKGPEAQITKPVGHRPSHRDGQGLQALISFILHNQRQLCSSAAYISVSETWSVLPAGVTEHSRERDLQGNSHHLQRPPQQFENRCLVRGNGHYLSLLYPELLFASNLGREEYICQMYQSQLLSMDLKGAN